jgi:hypothetical protein
VHDGYREELNPPDAAAEAAFRASPQRKNPPRISADGFLSEAIHFEQNTMFDRTSQTKFEVFF